MPVVMTCTHNSVWVHHIPLAGNKDEFDDCPNFSYPKSTTASRVNNQEESI